jgi:hypothetical protein
MKSSVDTSGWAQYRSHKIVRAAKITGFTDLGPEGVNFVLENKPPVVVARASAARMLAGAQEAANNKAGGQADPVHLASLGFSILVRHWLVSYPDGFISWSPSEAFESGYELVGDQGSAEQDPERLRHGQHHG